MEYLVGIVIILAIAVGIGVFVNRRSRARSGWVPYPRPADMEPSVAPVGGSGVQPAPPPQVHYQTPSSVRAAPAGYAPTATVVRDDGDDGLVAGLIIGQTIAAIADDLSQPDPTPVYAQVDDQPVQGGGGSFGGGGSDASWTPDPTPAPEPERYEAPAYDPPSYDSSPSYDSGSSGGDGN